MSRSTAALVIACVALFFSMAGAGLAASHYIITRKSQISPRVLKELRGLRGRTGATGATGAAGAAGAVGPRGSTGPAGPGSVTSVAAGTGLTGGTITSSGTLAVDPTAVQSRVNGTCVFQSAMTNISQSGFPTCTSGLTDSGDVSPNGTLNESDVPVTVARVGTGVYCVESGQDGIAVTPWYGSGAVTAEAVRDFGTNPNYGACTSHGYDFGFEVVMLDSSDSQVDSGFYFVGS